MRSEEEEIVTTTTKTPRHQGRQQQGGEGSGLPFCLKALAQRSMADQKAKKQVRPLHIGVDCALSLRCCAAAFPLLCSSRVREVQEPCHVRDVRRRRGNSVYSFSRSLYKSFTIK